MEYSCFCVSSHCSGALFLPLESFKTYRFLVCSVKKNIIGKKNMKQSFHLQTQNMDKEPSKSSQTSWFFQFCHFEITNLSGFMSWTLKKKKRSRNEKKNYGRVNIDKVCGTFVFSPLPGQYFVETLAASLLRFVTLFFSQSGWIRLSVIITLSFFRFPVALWLGHSASWLTFYLQESWN